MQRAVTRTVQQYIQDAVRPYAGQIGADFAGRLSGQVTRIVLRGRRPTATDLENIVNSFILSNAPQLAQIAFQLSGWIGNRISERLSQVSDAQIAAEASAVNDFIDDLPTDEIDEFLNNLDDHLPVHNGVQYLINHADREIRTNMDGTIENTSREPSAPGSMPAGPPNKPDVEMEGPPPTEAAAVRAPLAGGTSTNAGREETPILKISPTYGLEDTHTTILPYNGYFSIKAALGGYTAHDVKISLVNPRQTMVTTYTHVATTSTAAISGTMFDRKIISPEHTTWASGEALFPFQPSGSKCAWWDYWAKFYESFTVIGCHWRLIIDNVGYEHNDDLMVGWLVESYTASDTTGKAPNGAFYADAITWEGINWRLIEGNTQQIDSEGYCIQKDCAKPEIISGSYRPYLKKHLVQNDQDTKTWHKVTEALNMNEDLHLMFHSSPLGPGNLCYVNCALEMKFIVQFKDLKETLRFPEYADTAVAPAIPTDSRQSKIPAGT